MSALVAKEFISMKARSTPVEVRMCETWVRVRVGVRDRRMCETCSGSGLGSGSESESGSVVRGKG